VVLMEHVMMEPLPSSVHVRLALLEIFVKQI